jgi:hypothetical protein
MKGWKKVKYLDLYNTPPSIEMLGRINQMRKLKRVKNVKKHT